MCMLTYHMLYTPYIYADTFIENIHNLTVPQPQGYSVCGVSFAAFPRLLSLWLAGTIIVFDSNKFFLIPGGHV